MALALVSVALIVAGSLLGALYLARPYVDRAFSVLDRMFPPKEGTGPVEVLPSDIYEYCQRFQRKESRESEESAVRELYGKVGNWENVRVALGITGTE